MNIDTRNEQGQSALHLAIKWNRPIFVKQLLECGSNPDALWVTTNQQSSKGLQPVGYRPLHLACQIGSKEILSLIIISLLENISNFQLNEKTERGEDPLDLIIDNCMAQNEEIVDDRNNQEIFECIKLLIGTGHMIKQRHINKLKKLPTEPAGSVFVKNTI